MFLPSETWTDVQYCTLGIASCAKFYLTKFPGGIVVQRRKGTDRVEHHFAYIHQHVPGAHPTVVSAAQASTAAGIGSSLTGGTSQRAIAESNNSDAARLPTPAEGTVKRRLVYATKHTKETLGAKKEKMHKLNQVSAVPTASADAPSSDA
ncbi:hypothetical protein T492DRAFT_296193 [Pavlovales sp. CCMP2436]|nr:hypothetical protein T492DRAFT_296193 [Pavlovales sp. CCMP2436]